jgi:hypothetical protein
VSLGKPEKLPKFFRWQKPVSQFTHILAHFVKFWLNFSFKVECFRWCRGNSFADAGTSIALQIMQAHNQQ